METEVDALAACAGKGYGKSRIEAFWGSEVRCVVEREFFSVGAKTLETVLEASV